MLDLKNRTELFIKMRNGATVITPNNRLSNQLLHDFFLHFFASSHKHIDKPHCLPYSAFLSDLFKKVRHLYPNLNHPLLLSSEHITYLWRQIILKSNGECSDGLLREIKDAWANCQLWQIDLKQHNFPITPQIKQFQQWQEEFNQQIKILGVITEEQLVEYLLSHLKSINSTEIIWACFDDFTPTQKLLQNQITANLGLQYKYDLMPKETITHKFQAKDERDEKEHLINWLNLKLAAKEENIAVVIPDLQENAEGLERLLLKHFTKDEVNISLGRSLIDYPLIAHALLWLSISNNILISNLKANTLLYSPFIKGAKDEFNARSEAMQNLKILQENDILLTSFIKELKDYAPILSELLNNLSIYPEKDSISAWIGHFKTRLIDFGFPGEYQLDSTTYQCFQRFLTLLDELLQFSLICPLLTKQEALNALYDLAKTTIFQAQKKSAPIQILGLLEASGCTFDSIWICGLTDLCLPNKTKLSAFIPISLQQEHLFPHADAHRELKLAEQLLLRLKNSCNDLVLSYPRMTKDTPNLPSPLIKEYPDLISKLLPKDNNISALVKQNETYNLPLLAEEAVRGGTAILANQAKCPFRAFATHRLHAKPALLISDGPDMSERGQVIHKILDLIWRDIGSHKNLIALNSDKLQIQIEDAIKIALKPIINARSQSFSQFIQEVEFSRLSKLINTCLDWEKQRPPFEVAAVEQNFTIELAGINFQVRIDRLDIVSPNNKWVIDYKSSLPINKPWNEERPEAPQLLLYALLDDNINALLFLELKAGRVTCSGISEEEVEIKGLNSLKKDESWSSNLQKWHQQLTNLADEFRLGYCEPKPNRPSTCQNCDFPSLCRFEFG